jgi:hypothetical protein
LQISAATERWRAPGRHLATKATEVLPMKSNRGASDDYHINLKLILYRPASANAPAAVGRAVFY